MAFHAKFCLHRPDADKERPSTQEAVAEGGPRVLATAALSPPLRRQGTESPEDREKKKKNAAARAITLSEFNNAARVRRLRDHTVRFKADEIRHREEDEAVFKEPWYDFPERKAALLRLFRLLDTDNTGYLDAQKFRKMGRAQGGVDCTLAQAQMEISKADDDGDGMLSVLEWLKFSEPLRKMPVDAFLALMSCFTQALQPDDVTELIADVRKKQMFEAQDKYDDEQRKAEIARKHQAYEERRQESRAASSSGTGELAAIVSVNKGVSREAALIAEINQLVAHFKKSGEDVGFEEILKRISARHEDWNLTREDVLRAFQATKDAERVNRRVKEAAKESVLAAYDTLDPSWGIVVNPADL